MNENRARALEGEFRDLLGRDRHTPQHESDIQTFLEDNPFFLPGIHSSKYCPEGGKVVRKPQLGDYTPDFLFSCVNSQGRTYVLVEIEDPCKPLFTKRDAFTTEFRESLQQAKDWLGAWPVISERLALILSETKVLHEFYEQNIRRHIRCYLICGRRSQVETNRKRKERWSAEAGSLDSAIQVMTYDRLLDRPAPWVHATVYRYADKKLRRVRGPRKR